MMETQIVKSETRLEITRVLRSPVELVYRAWTEPEMMNGWFHPNKKLTSKCSADLQVGGRYEVQMQHLEGTLFVVSGTYQEIIPQKKLACTWRWEGEENETLVTVLFEALGNAGTRLTLLHERFTSEEERDSHAMGWEGMFEQLAAAVEQAPG